MIVSDILARVKRQFGDESGVQITDTDIKRWINDGMRQIVQTNEGLLEKAGTTNLVANTQEYALPTDLLILKQITCKPFGFTVYTKMQGFSFTDFNNKVDAWQDGGNFKGIPQIFTIFAKNIILWPTPETSATDGLKLYYNRIPTDVVNDSDTPEIPTLYHETLVDYCLQKAFEMDEDFEAVGVKAGEVNNQLATMRGRDDWKQQDTYPTITVLPEDDDGYYY